MVFVSLRQSIYHTVLSSAPLHKRLNILKLNCVAVHEKAALFQVLCNTMGVYGSAQLLMNIF